QRAISGLAPQPPNFTSIVALNRGALVTGGAEPMPLTPRQLAQTARDGALIDRGRGDEPWALLTGDTLFVGDVARPDLAVEKEDGARDMFHTLHKRLLTLAPETEIWPAHLGGSLCGGPGMDMKVSSTIGYELRHNELLHEEDEARFVERAISSLAPQPPNFKAIVALNRGPLVSAAAEPLPLTPRQLEQAARNGALIVDVRTDFQFDDAHVPGSVSNTMLRSGFGTKLAWIADRDQEIAFVGRDDADGHQAARLAAAVGITKVAGYLTGGLTSWRAENRDVGRIERVDVDELHALASDDDSDVQILDVREEKEWRQSRIPDSVHEPYHDIHSVPDGIDPARPVAAICMSGQRSAVAASLLSRFGAKRVLHVVPGGVGSWQRSGYPIENGA
ncbi:MAG: hydroxyacylglutathione hydrolase, partial [Thermoleophilaceae bacterium]|nr:hydroxyacylglutathione hydrolase [Thermoleophilaceae bacterium]